MKKKVFASVSMVNIIALVAVLVLPMLYFAQNANASALNIALIRTDRMQTSVATTGTVCARPTSVNTEAKVVLTFPATFALGLAATWTVDTSNTSSWPGSPTPTAWAVSAPVVASQTVTFTSPDLTVGTTYCFNWNLTTALTTGSAATGNQIGYVETQTAGSATIDKSAVAMQLVGVGADQVTVTGTVNPTFTYSLSATSANFASIANSVADVTTPPVVTITTNARNGWVTWVKDANNGTLNSVGTSSNIPTPGAVGSNYDLATMTGPGAFGLGVTTTGGSSAPSIEYSGVTAGHAGALSNNFRIAASSTAYATSDAITLRPRAIASTTQAPASDYTDLLTVIAAGQF